jgi:hypothetical protein
VTPILDSVADLLVYELGCRTEYSVHKFRLTSSSATPRFPFGSVDQITTMTPMIPDIVQDSKLETQFHSDPEHVQHIHYVSGSTPRQRKVRKEERWRRERWLGRGGYGTVESQLCIQGDSKGKLRAVKKMQKLASSDYYRELEAIALFSHNKVRELLSPCKIPLLGALC